ncbi:hypothetical protein GJ689_09885 [Rhodoplanes serenus]|uniref:Sel1 repeat family protein n=1 Tax=Rhodoplanes serenus TaxID=200615 RepID=A0A9X5AST2_9BRAD|nr:SEL1-like repeat protein [Rhodoplanes serenus]MTW16520.1 hypothetical protein [Rhodoplanes serenus]
MGRYDTAMETAALGEASTSAAMFFQLGMMYSTGSTMEPDYVSAHKWFNLAAMSGDKEAIRLRREIATLMTEAEIAAAQRAARAWLGR